MAIDSTTRELVTDCLSRIAAGDAHAAFDLVSAFMGHFQEKDIDLNLALIEGLASLAKLSGCSDAEAFLQDEWADMQLILRKRLAREGFINA